ncbi:cysteine-rich venom protein-like [Lytechinus variegatus]|uniref:cysteine-rich venom protein-like n=1 Tax=Lytechinus variegatus TaxID=7654 RepID=UPI001BB295B3|nr:cysteine-rich venom protein-like [Lytechinus variegatus]
MKAWKRVFLLLAVLCLSSVDGQSSESESDQEVDTDDEVTLETVSSSFSAEEAKAILDEHNRLRGLVSPEASNMQFMEWDDVLASTAQKWSDRCVFKHSSRRKRAEGSTFTSVGENIFAETGSAADIGVRGTESWYNETFDYDYEANFCPPEKMCGHYTQVVWASTQAVGCGKTFCAKIKIPGEPDMIDSTFFTCNYGPAGNVNRARPYLTGTSCTQCPTNMSMCYEKKCSSCTTGTTGCECKASCMNDGSLKDDCTCDCPNGYFGSDCSSVCANTHKYCGASPGWPKSWCRDEYPYVLENCPLMCETCKAPPAK